MRDHAFHEPITYRGTGERKQTRDHAPVSMECMREGTCEHSHATVQNMYRPNTNGRRPSPIHVDCTLPAQTAVHSGQWTNVCSTAPMISRSIDTRRNAMIYKPTDTVHGNATVISTRPCSAVQVRRWERMGKRYRVQQCGESAHLCADADEHASASSTVGVVSHFAVGLESARAGRFCVRPLLHVRI